MRKLLIWAVFIGIILPQSSQADDGRRSKADKHAPAGLMGDHVHGEGEWMIEYKFMRMTMDGNFIGDDSISNTSAITPVTVDGITTNGGASPTHMTMDMHMIHLMYGWTDDITIYTMLNINSNSMDHIRGPGNPAVPGTAPLGSHFQTHTSGIGDTVIGALIKLYQDDHNDVILNLGGSLPTGDIFSTSSRPTAGLAPLPLPYPMRLGTGTFNARPGITYKHYDDNSSFGAQFQTDIPIGRNYRGYSVSDAYQFNLWKSFLITDEFSLSVRLENLWRSQYDGADPQAPNLLISTNVEQFRGGYWLNLGVGASLLKKGHLFSIEAVPNLYQNVNGVQLGMDWSVVASWSKAF